MTAGLTGCGEPPKKPVPIDPEIALQNTNGQHDFATGDLKRAIIAYSRALDRARIMDDSPSIAQAAYNLAVCYSSDAQYTLAAQSLDECEYDLRRSALPLADELLVRARLSLLQQDPKTAKSWCNAIRKDPAAKPTAEQTGQSYVIEGYADVALTDAAGAKSAFDQATNLQPADKPYAAELAGLSGQIHLLASQFTAAKNDFDHQVLVNQSAGQFRQMMRAQIQAGRAALRAGDAAGGADRLYHAARAAVSRSDPTAGSLTKEALAAATLANNSILVQLDTALQASLATTMPTTMMVEVTLTGPTTTPSPTTAPTPTTLPVTQPATNPVP